MTSQRAASVAGGFVLALWLPVSLAGQAPAPAQGAHPPPPAKPAAPAAGAAAASLDEIRAAIVRARERLVAPGAPSRRVTPARTSTPTIPHERSGVRLAWRAAVSWPGELARGNAAAITWPASETTPPRITLRWHLPR